MPGQTQNTLKVICDSSFLFIPSQFNVDIFDELSRILKRRFEPVILTSTRRELQTIAETAPPKLRRQAALALEFSRRCRPMEAKQRSDESPDDVIVRIASKLACCVGTNDKTLKKRLRDRGVPVVFLRQKTHLAVEGTV